MTHKNEAHKHAASSWRTLLLALLCGLMFAAGLVLSGMTQPDKVIGFLNVAGLLQGPFPGAWDPTLAFVMGGAVLVTLLGFAWSARHQAHPWWAERFVLPLRQHVDAPLVLGAALFGVGWGLSGYCPGPALASIFTGGVDVLWFVGAMLVGMAVAKKVVA